MVEHNEPETERMLIARFKYPNGRWSGHFYTSEQRVMSGGFDRGFVGMNAHVYWCSAPRDPNKPQFWRLNPHAERFSDVDGLGEGLEGPAYGPILIADDSYPTWFVLRTPGVAEMNLIEDQLGVVHAKQIMSEKDGDRRQTYEVWVMVDKTESKVTGGVMLLRHRKDYNKAVKLLAKMRDAVAA